VGENLHKFNNDLLYRARSEEILRKNQIEIAKICDKKNILYIFLCFLNELK